MTKKENLLSFLLNRLIDERSVLLWNGRTDKDNFKSYIFTSPVEHIACYDKDSLISALKSIEQFQKRKYYIAGFISYEAGLYLDDIFVDIFPSVSKFPILWLGIYEDPIIYDHKKECFYNESTEKAFKDYASSNNQNCQIGNIISNIKRDDYINKIHAIKSAIERGETYQVNFTFKHKFCLEADPKSLFFELCQKQSASYSAFIRCDQYDILSLSPELFFMRNKDQITVKPMKGTIKRGINKDDDEIKANELYNSIKDQAENVMIVDLLRNDIGKMSKIGSVKVRKLYELEKYETLFQMTSTIESELRENVSWLELFKSIFPCGSVTGAPKIKTMQIINDLEVEPRHVYTGGIGFIAPDDTSVFNVAIRTVLVDRENNNSEMGIGSGIVYDSDAESEFRECLLKANFLTSKFIDFQLIETMLWEKGEYFLLDLHLKRLKDSAEYFMFDFNIDYIIKAIANESQKYSNEKQYKTRLLLFKDGNVTISSSELERIDDSLKFVTFSPIRTNPEDRFLYHKTTNRKIYNDEFYKARNEGYYDLLFLNNNDEITEGAISNIIIQKNCKFYTPPIKCGLLNGVFRQYLLENKPNMEEKILNKKDIIDADKVYLTNSVRGMTEVLLQR